MGPVCFFLLLSGKTLNVRRVPERLQLKERSCQTSVSLSCLENHARDLSLIQAYSVAACIQEQIVSEGGQRHDDAVDGHALRPAGYAAGPEEREE
eukprot:162711-Rhodomonas_salina.1